MDLVFSIYRIWRDKNLWVYTFSCCSFKNYTWLASFLNLSICGSKKTFIYKNSYEFILLLGKAQNVTEAEKMYKRYMEDHIFFCSRHTNIVSHSLLTWCNVKCLIKVCKALSCSTELSVPRLSMYICICIIETWG